MEIGSGTTRVVSFPDLCREMSENNALKKYLGFVPGVNYLHDCMKASKGYDFNSKYWVKVECTDKKADKWKISLESKPWAWNPLFIIAQRLGTGPSQEKRQQIARVLLKEFSNPQNNASIGQSEFQGDIHLKTIRVNLDRLRKSLCYKMPDYVDESGVVKKGSVAKSEITGIFNRINKELKKIEDDVKDVKPYSARRIATLGTLALGAALIGTLWLNDDAQKKVWSTVSSVATTCWGWVPGTNFGA